MLARRRFLCALAVAAALASPGFARAPAPGGGFFAAEAVTADPQRFVRQWEQPTPHVDLQTDSRFATGSAATAFVIFKNCREDAGGACDVSARFSLIGPGDRRMGPMTAQLWRGPSLGADVFMRARAAPTFRFPESYPAGVYRLVAVVTDGVAGTTTTVSVPVTYG